MKIIIIGPAYPWRGGIAHHSGLLAAHLSKRHEVELVTFSRQYPSFLFPGTSQYEEVQAPPALPAQQSIDSLNPLNWIRVGLALQKKAPALLLFTYSLPFFAPCYGTIAAIARRKPGIRTMFLCHNVIPHERRFGDRLLTRFAFAFADYFIVQSEAVQRDLVELRPDATFAMAHHPVFESFGNPIPKEEARQRLSISSARTLLFFGYVRQYKGLSVLLRALQNLHDVHLIVAGEFYDDEQVYRDLTRELNISERVRFVNSYVPGSDVPLYFSAADAVVVPYLSATQSGIIQLAFNFDKPVIASHVGGLSEVVTDHETGRLVPPGDAAALAGAIREFYEKNEEPRMTAAVSRTKSEFSWDKLVAAVESFMDRDR